MHARKQIRDAVVATLTGLTTTGSNVFASRPTSRPLSESALPALRIFMLSEAVDLVADASPQHRQLDLAVEAVVQGTTNLDDELDQICLEVETALLNNVPVGVHQITISSTDIEFKGDGDQPHGVARMTFAAEYYTREGAPEVML